MLVLQELGAGVKWVCQYHVIFLPSAALIGIAIATYRVHGYPCLPDEDLTLE